MGKILTSKVIAKRIQGKGILIKLLEQGVRFLLIKECKKISNLKIDIISNYTQIIKGEIQQIDLFAEDINYKDLLFDKIELGSNQLKINFNLTTKELYFKNDPIINFKISLSQNSLKTILFSNKWNYIRHIISKRILNQSKLEDIKIKNNQFFIKSSQEKNTLNDIKLFEIEANKGKIYLKNRANKEIIQIPVEEKIYFEHVNIKEDLINIYANSSVSF